MTFGDYLKDLKTEEMGIEEAKAVLFSMRATPNSEKKINDTEDAACMFGIRALLAVQEILAKEDITKEDIDKILKDNLLKG